MNNLFVIGKNKEDIKSLLLLDLEIVNNWFSDNMVANPGNWKKQLFVSGE